MKASLNPDAVTEPPTTIFPSAETSHASLEKSPPGRSPSPTIPPAGVQRNASSPNCGSVVLAEPLCPTTTLPLSLTACAQLSERPPGSFPSPSSPFNDVHRQAS